MTQKVIDLLEQFDIEIDLTDAMLFKKVFCGKLFKTKSIEKDLELK